MFGRPLLLVGSLAAAVIVPYVALDEKLKTAAQAQLARWTGEGKADSLAKPAPADLANDAAPSQTPTAASLPTTVPLEEALRFDVTPEWVTSRWPRVTSVIGDSEHLGLRVALVSGTQSDDVAGSLTYYFDQQHQLQRLTLSGVSGDQTRLVGMATGHFGLRPTQTKDRGLYLGGDKNTPTSSLRVSDLPVVRAEATHARVQIALDLKRADVAQLKTEEERPEKILPSSYRRW